MPCGKFAGIIEKKMEVTCSQVRLSERKPSPEEKVAHTCDGSYLYIIG